MLNASSRIALAAYLHDLGKFAERARLEFPKSAIDAHITQYCPFRDNKYHTHKHAAYTGLAMDEIEKSLPDLIQGDMAPFASRKNGQNITDSLINAAAAHHKPDTFLQWIIATADRVASGFERDEFDHYNLADDENKETGHNHYQARQLTLFEKIRVETAPTEKDSAASYKFCYPLKPLSPEALFPVKRADYEPSSNEPAQAEYQALWNSFTEAINDIPTSHRKQWALWLDHFDSAWQSFTHAIPSATAFGIKPDVSLYDHSKTTAALATALWRWHADAGQTDTQAATDLKQGWRNANAWQTEKFLLIQGDFFGIQDFIFADGSQTNKAAAKLLRGRSFQVSLIAELAALKILNTLELPPTSQILNAAGKFLIVAPNTPDISAKIAHLRNEFDQWFLTHSFGLAGIGIACKAASCHDFTHSQFQTLVKNLFAELEGQKLRRFNLTGNAPTIFNVDYPKGTCAYNDRLPADKEKSDDKPASAALSRDQILLGHSLTQKDRLLVLNPSDLLQNKHLKKLELPIFGYQIAFTEDEDRTGNFGKLVESGTLLRCWDFSAPETLNTPLFNGYARRYINAHVPHFGETDPWSWSKYQGIADDIQFEKAKFAPKTLNHIACDDRNCPKNPDQWQGKIALTTLKGDVDNLGKIFEKGLTKPTFAKMAALSRQMNAFFAIWLPAYCAEHYPNTYTVFAGGDDFFLIGPWLSTQKLAVDMAIQFKCYVAENPEIHFSAGMVMTKPGIPIATLASQAEDALDKAKEETKNAVVVHGEKVKWADWQQITTAQEQLSYLADEHQLSTAYIYSLLHLIDLASDTKRPDHAMWRSRFAYRTQRMVVDKVRDATERRKLQTALSIALGEQGIATLGTRYRIPLFNYFYQLRS